MQSTQCHSAGEGRGSPVRRWLPLLLLPAMLALSCGDEPRERLANQRPLVQLTPRPDPAGRLGYATSFHWTGFDMDGLVDYYQYAIDVPDSVGLDRLNDPAGGGVAWRDTLATGAVFHFSTPAPDSAAGSDSVMAFTGVYVGRHSLYVRAVDNEGAVSDADYVVFTAENVMPETEFLLPVPPGPNPPTWIYRVGDRFSVRWTGEDPDCPGGPCAPAWYEWKLVPGIGNPAGVTDPGAILRRDPGPWHRVSGDSTGLVVPLNPPEEYVFAVRAIDRAGAVEDLFHLGRNAVVLMAGHSIGLPTLTVSERSLGSFTVPTDGNVAEYEVAAGQRLTFHFSADLQAWGGVLEGYNWGVDVVDVEDEGPGSPFHGWSLIPYADPICFQTPGVHNLVVKARDTGGGTTIATILLHVIDFPRDRGVLYVDDFRLASDGPVTDASMDAQVRAMLVAAGCPEQDVFQGDPWGTGDGAVAPGQVHLSDLARYRLVVWSVRGAGYQGRTALTEVAACGPVLRSYLSAGGAAWIFGQQVFGALKRERRVSDCRATLAYDEVAGLSFGTGDFVADYLHIQPGDFRGVRNTKNNGLVRARPAPEALAELFPSMVIDSTVYNAAVSGGIPFVDAMFWPTFAAGLDTLYTMETPKASPFRSKPVAFRYLDPDPGARQGPLAVFGFPFHLLKQGSAAERTGVQGMARAMIAWFRAHGAG